MKYIALILFLAAPALADHPQPHYVAPIPHDYGAARLQLERATQKAIAAQELNDLRVMHEASYEMEAALEVMQRTLAEIEIQVEIMHRASERTQSFEANAALRELAVGVQTLSK